MPLLDSPLVSNLGFVSGEPGERLDGTSAVHSVVSRLVSDRRSFEDFASLLKRDFADRSNILAKISD